MEEPEMKENLADLENVVAAMEKGETENGRRDRPNPCEAI
jgi:hypothetical protein